MQLFEKDALQQLHWSLDDIDNTDYSELMEVLSADENNKMIDPADLAKQFMLWKGDKSLNGKRD